MKQILFTLIALVAATSSYAAQDGTNDDTNGTQASTSDVSDPEMPVIVGCPLACPAGTHCQRIHRIVPEDGFICAKNFFVQ